MSNAKVVPREEVEKLGEQFGQHPVGSGPFAFVRWGQRQEIVLQAYNFYYEGRPFLDQIVFKISTDKQFEEDFATFLKGRDHCPQRQGRGDPEEPALSSLYVSDKAAPAPPLHRFKHAKSALHRPQSPPGFQLRDQ